jgi:hypothetical protein
MDDKNIRLEDRVTQDKLPFSEPKLVFVEPVLKREGGMNETTAGFFGVFSP